MTRGLLKYNPQFMLVWLGQTASIFGDRVTGLALPWLLLRQTHSTFEAGMIIVMRYIPLVLFGLVAGLVVDRLNRRIVLIFCDVLRAGALCLVVLMGVFRLMPPLWLLAGVVFVLGVGQLFFLAAYRAWLPDVIPEEALSDATAALEASDAASTLAGPLLGGFLIQALGAVLALGVDALSYILSALTFLFIPDKPIDDNQRKGVQENTFADLWRQAGEGIRFILSTPDQRLLKGISAALYIHSGAIELLLSTLTQVVLHLQAWQAGFVFGAAGIGGLIGSAVAPRFYRKGWRKSIVGALLLAAVANLGLMFAGLLASWLGFVLALVCNLLLDGGVAFSFILVITENILVTPREIRGRVNAASNMYSSVIQSVSVLVMGWLVMEGQTAPAFALLFCCFIGALWLARRRYILKSSNFHNQLLKL